MGPGSVRPETRPLRGLGPRSGALWVAALMAAACGRVEFGEDLEPLDAGVEFDASTDAEPRDVGSADADVDAGPRPDLGCVEVELPRGLPAEWPFGRTSSGYRSAFYDPIGNAAGCALATCHGREGAGPIPPFIPQEMRFEEGFERAIDELWEVMGESPPLDRDNPSGRLWRHLRGHPEYEAPAYLAAVPAQIEGLRLRAERCHVDLFLRDPPPNDCDPEADAGLCPCPLPEPDPELDGVCVP